MAEKRTCRRCGNEYSWPVELWAHKACPIVAARLSVPKTALVVEPAAEDAIPPKKSEKPGKFDKVKYQRWYMRRRRAAAKLASRGVGEKG